MITEERADEGSRGVWVHLTAGHVEMSAAPADGANDHSITRLACPGQWWVGNLDWCVTTATEDPAWGKYFVVPASLGSPNGWEKHQISFGPNCNPLVVPSAFDSTTVLITLSLKFPARLRVLLDIHSVRLRHYSFTKTRSEGASFLGWWIWIIRLHSFDRENCRPCFFNESGVFLVFWLPSAGGKAFSGSQILEPLPQNMQNCSCSFPNTDL